MSDLEMLKACADSMGLRLLPAYRKGTILGGAHPHRWKGLMTSRARDCLFIESGSYNPLKDDAQAFALLNKFGLGMNRNSGDVWEACWFDPKSDNEIRFNVKGLHRAIVECVAQIPRPPSTSGP